MRFVYFTKTLAALDTKALIQFLRDTGLHGLDLAVRPGYPVTPANARTELPALAKQVREAGFTVEIASAATTLDDPAHADVIAVFEAAAAAQIPFVKVGYAKYTGRYAADLAKARQAAAGFAALAARTGVKAAFHTHSGRYLGCNAAGLRAVLDGTDPKHAVAYADTGHLGINGGPFPMELDILGPHFGLLAIKDMALVRGKDGATTSKVVPAGQGVTRWADVAAGLTQAKYAGPISVHGEYETHDLAERVRAARDEVTLLMHHGIGAG